jgi:ubiquinone/menaquinone biosynthesis C-methylase UbiE
MPEHQEIEYDDTLVTMLEIIWGEGFLSPGGAEEVALLLEGEDISGKKVIDIGCGIGGIDVLLVHEHGAAGVTGVDIEQPVLDQSMARAGAKGLSDRLSYRLVEPGPLPFEPASFDVVFSKDAMIHIPDKEALFADVYRILRPGGLFVASDWMRCDDNPASSEMEYYLKVEGLNFGMASPGRYAKALEKAGFFEIRLRDRNAWYRDLSRKEYEQMKGPLYPRMVELLGRANADRYVEIWRAMHAVIASGELCPGHLRAVRPPAQESSGGNNKC